MLRVMPDETALKTDAIERLSRIVREAEFIQTEKVGVSLYGAMLARLADDVDAELTALREEIARKDAAESVLVDGLAVIASNLGRGSIVPSVSDSASRPLRVTAAGTLRAAGFRYSSDGWHRPEAALASPPSDTVLVKREMLREIEWCVPELSWGEETGHSLCPVCEQVKPYNQPSRRTQAEGHAPDCWLAAAIGSADGD